jgi:hypothetical protein
MLVAGQRGHEAAVLVGGEDGEGGVGLAAEYLAQPAVAVLDGRSAAALEAAQVAAEVAGLAGGDDDQQAPQALAVGQFGPARCVWGIVLAQRFAASRKRRTPCMSRSNSRRIISSARATEAKVAS